MSNPGMKLTRAGMKILAQGLLGDEIHFTKVAFGDADFDYNTEDLRDLTALKSWQMDLPIIGRQLNGDGTVTITALCTNFTLTKGFPAKEIGVFAIDQETQTEVLYAYRNAGDEYSFIPAKMGVVTKSVRYAYQIEIRDAENVTFDINFSFAYVSQEDFEKHVESENPHPQFKETQRLAWENRLLIKAQAFLPFDANLIIFEDFLAPSVSDHFKLRATNCVAGADLITVKSFDNIRIGDYYWISDGANFEQVKIVSAMKNASGLHLKTSANLAHTYHLKKTYLYHSTFEANSADTPDLPLILFTNAQTAEVDLMKFSTFVVHSELGNADISAYAILYETPKKRENITLGTGDTDKIFPLNDANILPDSLQVEVDGVSTANYFFETDNPYIQLTAPTDSTVTASYLYGGESQIISLDKLDTFREDDHFVTRFDGETDLTGYKTAAMAIVINRHGDEQPKLLHVIAGFGA